MHVDILFICQDPWEVLGWDQVRVRREDTSVSPHAANPPLQLLRGRGRGTGNSSNLHSQRGSKMILKPKGTAPLWKTLFRRARVSQLLTTWDYCDSSQYTLGCTRDVVRWVTHRGAHLMPGTAVNNSASHRQHPEIVPPTHTHLDDLYLLHVSSGSFSCVHKDCECAACRRDA